MCKKTIIALSLLSAVSAVSAHAASTGTITFNGELTDSTCDVTINDGTTADGTVTLPTLSVSELAAKSEVAGKTDFHMNLTKCSPVTGAGSTVSAFFEQGATVDSQTGNLLNTLNDDTGAKNVQLQLLDGSKSYSAIKAGSSSQVTDAGYVAVAEDGTAYLPYAVQYFATNKTTAGKVTSSVVYSLQYK